jgi:hypothetical protein
MCMADAQRYMLYCGKFEQGESWLLESLTAEQWRTDAGHSR